METWEWVASAGGALLALLVLIDVFLTVLHMDRDGPIAHSMIRLVWHAALFVAGGIPRAKTMLSTLAGPTAIAAVFGTWVALFILAFAVLYWPHMALFRAESALGEPGFLTALYFSGNVSTVLGFGDVTPLLPGLQTLAFVQAALGFGVLTAAVTYLVSVISAAGRRNALTQRLWFESSRTGDGLESLLTHLEAEDMGDVHGRFRSLTSALYDVEEQLRRLPVIDLLYRSGSREHAPEVMLRSSGSLAIAAGIASGGAGGTRLGPVAREMAAIVTRIMRNATAAWFGREALARFDRAPAEAADVKRLVHVRDALIDRLPHLGVPRDLEPGGELLELQSRLRIFVGEAREKMIWY